MTILAFILAGTLAAATPLLLVALGELIVERSGVLNLGLEGMMALGAAVGFVVTWQSQSHVLGFAAAALAGILLSLVFAALALGFMANQVAAGLAIGVLGLGLSSLVGKPLESQTVNAPDKLAIPGLSDLPLFGPVFDQDGVVWLTFAMAAAIWFVLNRSKLGLVIRAVGENPHAARAIGFPVLRIRLAAIAFGGALAGMANT